MERPPPPTLPEPTARSSSSHRLPRALDCRSPPHRARASDIFCAHAPAPTPACRSLQCASVSWPPTSAQRLGSFASSGHSAGRTLDDEAIPPDIPRHCSVSVYDHSSLSLARDDSVDRNSVESPTAYLPEYSFSSFTATSVMNAAAKVAGIVDKPDPHADPYRDVEAGNNIRPNENASRVSLPLSHQRSFSFASTRRGRRNSTYSRATSERGGRPSTTFSEAGDGQDEEEYEEEIPWGKDHPCYPHLNPHVPMDSPLWEQTRIIRIKRDWMIAGDLAPTFTRVYPEILDPVMPQERFKDVVEHINAELQRIHDPFRGTAWLDAGMGFATGWLWDDLGLTRTKKELRALDVWMERWNKQYGEGEGVRLIPLRRTAYLCLDIQIPDPVLGPDVAESEADGELDARRSQDSRQFGAGRSNSQRGFGSSRAGSNYSASQAAGEANGAAGGRQQPEVPQIPGKYLTEAQQQVEKHVQQRQGGEA